MNAPLRNTGEAGDPIPSSLSPREASAMDAARQDVAVSSEAAVPTAAGTSETATILSLIDRAARDPNLDLGRMERLFEMRERALTREAETAFNAAMQAAQAEMPRVYRDAKNTQANSRYARLESIAKAAAPIYTKHGFSLSFGTDASPLDGHYRVTCEVRHVGGHSITRQADLPSDVAGFKGNANKTPIQGFGSTMSYGRRYLTLLIFNIALTDEDDDGRAAHTTAKVISDAQDQQIRNLLTETKSDLNLFFGFFKIESVSDLPAARFDEAVRMLKAKRSRADDRR